MIFFEHACCTREVNTSLLKYAELFREELETLKGVKVKLVVPENATAKFSQSSLRGRSGSSHLNRPT